MLFILCAAHDKVAAQDFHSQDSTTDHYINPNPVTNGYIVLEEVYEKFLPPVTMHIFTLRGEMLLCVRLSGQNRILLPPLPSGAYMANIFGSDNGRGGKQCHREVFIIESHTNN